LDTLLAKVNFDQSYLTYVITNHGMFENPEKMVNILLTIVNHYREFISGSIDIAVIAKELINIINDEQHPLKFRQIGILNYGVTNSYAQVIDCGKNRLISLLNNDPILFAKLDLQTKANIYLISDTKTLSLEAQASQYISSIFIDSKNDSKKEKSPSEKLADFVSFLRQLQNKAIPNKKFK
jgi:hypothetical protein